MEQSIHANTELLKRLSSHLQKLVKIALDSTQGQNVDPMILRKLGAAVGFLRKSGYNVSFFNGCVHIYPSTDYQTIRCQPSQRALLLGSRPIAALVASISSYLEGREASLRQLGHWKNAESYAQANNLLMSLNKPTIKENPQDEPDSRPTVEDRSNEQLQGV